MSLASRVYQRCRSWLLRETSALPIDVFRILVGLLGSAYFVRLLLEVQDFSHPDGLIDHDFLARIYWFTRLSLFHPGLEAAAFYLAYTVGVLGAWGIVLGYRPKLWAAILYLIAISSYRWNFPAFSVDDAIMHLLLFWLVLLPIGQTLTLRDWLQEPRGCLARWSRVTVPGASMRCLLGNICLMYLTAGLCKFESSLWRQGFALYAIFRLPIAYDPDLVGPQHLPLLRIGTYLVLVVEPLLPWLLTRRPWHPLKWLGLLLQAGFHLCIIATLRVPFANLGVLASAVLFFRQEIMQVIGRRQEEQRDLQTGARFRPADRIALALVGVLALAMMRGLPVVGEVHKPAFALLWMAGLAQDYQLFSWIDITNVRGTYRVEASPEGGSPHRVPPEALFPVSMRSVLLQAYIHGVPWMRVPIQHRRAFRRGLVSRFAQRFCRKTQFDGNVKVWSHLKRITPSNVALQRGRKRLLTEFRCAHGDASLVSRRR